STGAAPRRPRRASERAPGRGSAQGPVVAITGAARGLGHALAVRLAALAADSDQKSRRSFNVRAAQTVLTAAAAGRVGRVVLVTSAMVYGARPDNPVPLAETAPLGADADGSGAGDLLEIEHLARRSPRAHPGMAITVVRPAALVGEGVDTL